MAEKLRNTAGESIAETLIALLISALALMILAGAVSTVANIITKSNAKMTEYYTADNQLANNSGENVGVSVTVKSDIKDWTPEIRSNKNSTFESTPVISYVLVD